MVNQAVQLPLLHHPSHTDLTPTPDTSNGVISSNANHVSPEDRAFHDWYRFVLSYPPHLVRDYIKDFGLREKATLSDPFCGTGTTVVEAKLNDLRGIGLEANPFPQFASSVKTDWTIDPDLLDRTAREIAQHTAAALNAQGIHDNPFSNDTPEVELRRLDPHTMKLLIKDSISPLPLHKTLVLLDSLQAYADKPLYKYGLLALGNALVGSIGNLRFGPEVGIGKKKHDAPVVAAWLAEIQKMVADLLLVQGKSYPDACVYLADARDIGKVLEPNSVDAVITSPPYPNEKDYTRTTRLESVMLGFYDDMSTLRSFKKSLLRSNTRGVYKTDGDDRWVEGNPQIQRLAEEIEQRRIELGKTSGFEKLYARLTKLYFGGMARHFAELRTVLRPGAQLAYVVGDQASYLRVMIRTGTRSAEIAQQLGYELVRIDLFRTRFATATQSELREEVVVLCWPG